jgi:hypothetical protein
MIAPDPNRTRNPIGVLPSLGASSADPGPAGWTAGAADADVDCTMIRPPLRPCASKKATCGRHT